MSFLLILGKQGENMQMGLRQKLTAVVFSLVLLVALFPASANANIKTVAAKRGSILQWSKNYVRWEHTNGKVLWSDGWQSTFAIVPNFVNKDGINRYLKQTDQHRWRGNNTFGAKIGDYILWSYTTSDTIVAWGAGGYCINCPGY